MVLLALAPNNWGQAPNAPRPSASLTASLTDAKKAMDERRFSDAETTLRVYLALYERSSEARYMLAYSLLREGKAKDSLEEYTRAAALRTPTAGDLRNVGEAYVLLGDYDDAGKWMQRALTMEPGNADTLYNLGRLRYTENRFAESVGYFQRVLGVAPRNVKAENNLGLAFEGLDRMADAEAAYRQAIAWQDAGPPGELSEQPLINLAIVLLHRNDAAGAEPLLERAAKLAPKDPRIHEQLGQLYMQQSKFADAQRELKTACDLDPGKSNLHFLLGQAYKRLGRQNEAAAEFAESSRLARITSQAKPN
jgi:Flp pilus assembly protein TadD